MAIQTELLSVVRSIHDLEQGNSWLPYSDVAQTFWDSPPGAYDHTIGFRGVRKAVQAGQLLRFTRAQFLLGGSQDGESIVVDETVEPEVYEDPYFTDYLQIFQGYLTEHVHDLCLARAKERAELARASATAAAGEAKSGFQVIDKRRVA